MPALKNIEEFDRCMSDSLDRARSGTGASSIANSLSANGLSGLSSGLQGGLPSSLSAIDLTDPSGISGNTASSIVQGTQSGKLLSSVPMSKLAIPGSGNGRLAGVPTTAPSSGDISGLSTALSAGDISGLSNGLASVANRGGLKGFGNSLPSSPINLADPSSFTGGGSTHTPAATSGKGTKASSGGGGGSRIGGAGSHFGGAGRHFGGSAINNTDPADNSGVKYSTPNGASPDTSSPSPLGPPSGSNSDGSAAEHSAPSSPGPSSGSNSDGSPAAPSTGYGTSKFSYPPQSSPDGAVPGAGDPSATGPSTSTTSSTGDGTPNANDPSHVNDPSVASGPSTGYPTTFGTAGNGNSASSSPDNGDDAHGPPVLAGAGSNRGGAGRGAGGISHFGKPISNCDGPACTDIDLISNGGRVKSEPAVTYTSTDLPGLQKTKVPNVSEEETGCPGGDINVCADN